jgi:hypothetical protein
VLGISGRPFALRWTIRPADVSGVSLAEP